MVGPGRSQRGVQRTSGSLSSWAEAVVLELVLPFASGGGLSRSFGGGIEPGGGAVEERTMSSVASSTWRPCGSAPVDHRQQHLRRGPTHLRQRLADGRERWRHPSRDREVVEAHHAEVLGHPPAGDPRRFGNPERLFVAASKDGGRRIRQLEQLAGCLIATDVVEVAGTDQGRVDLDAREAPGRRGTRRCGPGCTASRPVHRSPRSAGDPARADAAPPRARRPSSSRPRSRRQDRATSAAGSIKT